jgi:hypothetical protein
MNPMEEVSMPKFAFPIPSRNSEMSEEPDLPKATLAVDGWPAGGNMRRQAKEEKT